MAFTYKEQAKSAGLRGSLALEIRPDESCNPPLDEEDFLQPITVIEETIQAQGQPPVVAKIPIWPIHKSHPDRMIFILKNFVKASLNPSDSFADRKNKAQVFMENLTGSGDAHSFIVQNEQEIFFQ